MLIRSRHPETMKESVIKNCEKITGKHLRRILFFNKVAGLQPATLFKKRLQRRCFPVNFERFLRTAYLQNISGCLLLINPSL